MKKLIALIISVFLSYPAFADIECFNKLELVLDYRLHKLDNPEYVQVIKNKIKDEAIPIVQGGTEVYSTNKNINTIKVLMNNNAATKLFKSDLVKVNYNIHNLKSFIIYPVKDMKRRYITGFLVLGYNQEIDISTHLNMNLDLIETYLSQILDICDKGD